MTLQKNKLLNWFLVFALSLTALDCFSHSRSESYSKINVLNNGNFYQVNLSANISNTILNNFLRLNVFKSADDVRNYASSSFKQEIIANKIIILNLPRTNQQAIQRFKALLHASLYRT